MKIPGFLLLFLLVAACSDTDSKDPDESAVDEPPFFVADKNGTGPLTLDELQINIPKKIDRVLTDNMRSCFFEAVERRASEAGDPADIDPQAFPYWGGKVDQEKWGQHSQYMQRVLLAQAIVSWAMIDC